MNEKLCSEIRHLAGQIGETLDPDDISKSDADSYDYRVLTGLASASMEILEHNPSKLFYWLGFCFLGLGLDEIDPKIQALMDALEYELIEQLDAMPED